MAKVEKTYARLECAVFRRTHEQYGAFSNMAGGFPIRVNGVQFRNAEALYQACRFPDYPGIQRRIQRTASPIIAKRISRGKRRRYGRKDWDQVQNRVMMWCLRAKLACNYRTFAAVLRSTGRRKIVEESARDRYWGAVRKGRSQLVGANTLGRMLQRLRTECVKRPRAVMMRVRPPAVSGLNVMGKPVGTIVGRPTKKAERHIAN